MIRDTGDCAVALLLIDVINAFDFPGSDAIVAAAEAAAPAVRALSDRAREAPIPVIYVNDNFGQWRSDFRSTVRRCAAREQPGARVTDLLMPTDEDYFVLKPMHSGFYRTPLDLLLERLGVRHLVLCGFATNICVLFTANDAYMRRYRVTIAGDCCAANSPALHEQALEQMRLVCDATIQASPEIDFEKLRRE